MSKRSICIHGHFYQPPRENPWTNKIEEQKSAAPFHDWNERITAECYTPNSQAKIVDKHNKPVETINNYSKISFNFGPTLLLWLKEHAPKTYAKILEADVLSQKEFAGHGAAIAQCYSHMIMPLANEKDKQTQIVWGIRDFESRFNRKSEGMWLPETAVDVDTLEQLAAFDIAFTILAPHQARRVRKIGEQQWENIKEWGIETNRAYLCRLPSGKSISLFFYDGSIAHDVAFGKLLKSGEHFAKRLMGEFSDKFKESEIVHFATDGESYGHHHKFSEMALAYMLQRIESSDDVSLAVYAQYLKENPPLYEVEIEENTSWSCVHGIARWHADCGCRLDSSVQTSQGWRKPLRKALDFVRDECICLFEEKMKGFGVNPWDMRNDYIALVLDPTSENGDKFFDSYDLNELSENDKKLILQLLELQKYAMLMYTSCGWFFDDIGRIETRQILQYAAKAMELARVIAGLELEEAFLRRLTLAQSNDPVLKNGRVIFEQFIKPLTNSEVK